MQPVIYLDVFFALNFLMDFFLLIITRKISVNSKPLYRTTAASAVGAVYACIVVVTKIKYSIAEMVFTYLIIAVLMAVTAFGYGSIKVLVKHTGLLYAVVFFVCGIINIVYYRSSFGTVIYYAAQYEVMPGMSLIMLIVGIIIAGSILEILPGQLSEFFGKYNSLYVVTLFNNGDKIRVKALVDTGNDLFDPISGKPVSVADCEDIMQVILKDGNAEEKFRAIPFHSVGEKAGIMEAYRIDRIEIEKDGEVIKIDGPIVAVYKGKLSGDGEYQMLLNQKLFKI